MKNILLIFGGNSHEHEVSIKSAENIYKYIDKSIFHIDSVYISKKNIWYKFDNNFKQINIKKLNKVDNIINTIKKYDLIFNIIHGNDGEDGKLESFFELFNIKYIGSNNAGSFICMNKSITKLLLESHNIKTTPFVIFKNLKDTMNKLSFPMIVKPDNCGSSIGISKVNNELELKNAIKSAKKYSKRILIEKYIKAREFECAVLEVDGYIKVSNVGEIILNNELYDYNDKYVKNKSTINIPAEISEKLRKKIKNISKKAFTICGCKGLARIDFLYDYKNKKLYLNEINTLPGFTDISMYPSLFNFEGISYKELLTILITNALH